VEFASKQKDLDVNLGMRMFGTLMTHYFEKSHSTENVAKVKK